MIKRGREFWVTLIVIVLVIAMILPLYNLVNIFGNRGGEDDRDPVNPGPEDSMEQNRKLIASLEKYLEENEPGVYLLRELADAYTNQFYYLYYSDSEEGLGYLKKAVAVLEQVIELEPREPESYMRLYDVYRMMNLEDKAAEQAVRGEELLRELLQEDPDDNINRYYLSILLEEYYGDAVAAREQMDIILSSEPEDSELYLHVWQRIAQIDGTPEGDSDMEAGDDDGREE